MKIHDHSYRRIFHHSQMIEALLTFVPGDWQRDVDLSSLQRVSDTFVSQALQKRRSDMIWRLQHAEPGDWIYLYLMLEFQSRDEPFMAARALNYAGLFYDQLLAESKHKRGQRLPLLLPLVLYNGERPWRSTNQVADLIEAPPSLEWARPRFAYHLIEERALPADQLASLRGNPVAGVFRIEQNKDLGELPALIQDLAASLRGDHHAILRKDLADWLLRIFVPEDMEIPDIHDLEEVTDMYTRNMENWKENWKKKAAEELRQQAIEECREQVMAEALQEELRKGERQGEAKILLRLLERKFGSLDELTRRRIETAESERLLEWGERLVVSDSLAEVFAPD